jgi:hypothetical protein
MTSSRTHHQAQFDLDKDYVNFVGVRVRMRAGIGKCVFEESIIIQYALFLCFLTRNHSAASEQVIHLRLLNFGRLCDPSRSLLSISHLQTWVRTKIVLRLCR